MNIDEMVSDIQAVIALPMFAEEEMDGDGKNGHVVYEACIGHSLAVVHVWRRGEVRELRFGQVGKQDIVDVRGNDKRAILQVISVGDPLTPYTLNDTVKTLENAIDISRAEFVNGSYHGGTGIFEKIRFGDATKLATTSQRVIEHFASSPA